MGDWGGVLSWGSGAGVALRIGRDVELLFWFEVLGGIEVSLAGGE